MDFLRYRSKLFTTQTGIKGFQFFNNAKYPWEKAVWTIALIACSVVTAMDVYNTIELYISGPTMTMLRMNSSVPVTLPSLKCCIMYHPFKALNFYDQQFYHKYELFEYLDKMNVLINLDRMKAKMNLDITDFKQLNVASFLTSISSLGETHDLTQESQTLTYMYDKGDMLETSALGTYYLRKVLPEVAVIGQNVTKSIALLMWNAMNLQVFTGRQPFNYTPIDIDESHITWLGTAMGLPMSQICFKVNDEYLKFSDRYDAVRITFNHLSLLRTIPDLKFILYFGPNPLVTPEIENAAILNIGMGQLVLYQMIGQFHSMSTYKAPCGRPTGSLIDCQLVCQSKYIESKCLCSPLYTAYTSVPGRYPLCSQIPNPKLRNCSSNIVSQAESTCGPNCNPPCLRYLIIYTKEVYPNNNVSDVIATFVSFIYPEFHETEAMDTKSLLSRLGGNLSLWIGASFLVLLHSAMFLIQLPLEYIMAKQKPKSTIYYKTNMGDMNSYREEFIYKGKLDIGQLLEAMKNPAVVNAINIAVQTKPNLQKGVYMRPYYYN